MLIVTRFLAGIGIGAELPLVDAYLSELLPARHRGRYTAWAYTLGFIGVPAAGFLARMLVPRQPLGIDGWRWMFVAGSLGAAIVWALRAKLPESPRWLESVGTHRGGRRDRLAHGTRGGARWVRCPPPRPGRDARQLGHATVPGDLRRRGTADGR